MLFRYLCPLLPVFTPAALARRKDRRVPLFKLSQFGIAVFCCGLAVPGAALPAAETDAQNTAPALAAPPSRSTGTAASPASTQPEGKARIYVYRKGSRMAAMAYPLLFVNDYPLAVLSRSTYAWLDVAPDTTVVSLFSGVGSAVAGVKILRDAFPPRFQWPTCTGDPRKAQCEWNSAPPPAGTDEYGCAKLNWKRMDTAHLEDLKVCRAELVHTNAALMNWIDPHRKAGELALGLVLGPALGGGLAGDAISGPHGDQSAWLHMCGPEPFGEPSAEAASTIRDHLKHGDNTDNWSRCQNSIAAARAMLDANHRIRIDTEPGKSYYVQWVLGARIELVDAERGAEDIRQLRPLE